MELAEHFFKKFSNKEKVECTDIAFRLCLQIMQGYGLGSPYYLALDNDVLNALQKPNEYPIRYSALISFFRTINQQHGDFRIVINPAIFYEFNGDRAFESESEFQFAWELVHRTIARTGLPIYSVGLSTLGEAKRQLKSIRHDVRTIHNALNKINSREWAVNLRHENLITFPHAIAKNLCPQIRVKYFSSHHTQSFLESVIESKIIHNKKNDSFARKKMRSEFAIKKSKLLEATKTRLKGIGDLSLLSSCDIGSQFFRGSQSTAIGITFDGRLEWILAGHARIGVSSSELHGGPENEMYNKEKLREFIEAGNAITKVNNDAHAFGLKFCENFFKLEWVRDAMENKPEG